jgi:hypothetical protein
VRQDVTRDVEIDTFLRAEGFAPDEARDAARRALEAAGLTRGGKRRMAEAKLPAARAALAAGLSRVCDHPECARLAAGQGDRRPAVRVAPASCEICGGSNVRRATRALARCLAGRGVRRLLVVGGKGPQHAEIEGPLAEAGLEVRFVDGRAGSFSRRDAGPDLDWAELLVVWGATPLPHKVSKLYTDDVPSHLRGRTVKLARRGVEAVCREVMDHFGCRWETA